jgi:hypothetical protein
LAKKLLRLLLLVLSFASAALAQQTPSWEIFGGYSFERAGVKQYYKSTPILYTSRERYLSLNGFELSVTENVNRWLGGTLQFTGHFKSPVILGSRNREQTFSLMYGPRFAHRMTWATAYGQVLLGAGRASVSVSPGPHAKETSFAAGAGIGLDLNLGKKTSVRVLQVQYSPMNQIVSKDHKFQASAGVVFNLGNK